MNEKRSEMLGVMTTPTLKEKMRQLAFERRMTESSFAFYLLSDAVAKIENDKQKEIQLVKEAL